MRYVRSHLSFANVMSVIALFVALGGTSIAAVSLSKNSVGAKQIKKNAVRAAEIKRNAVGASEVRSNAIAGGDVADGSIGAFDIGDDAIGSGELAADSAGSDEIQANGVGSSELADNSVGSGEVIDGSLGAGDLQAGLLNHDVTVQFEQHTADLANGAEVSLDVHCPAGQTAIGGGTRGDLNNSELTKVTASRPIISTANTGAPNDNGTFTGWRGTFVNENNGAGIRPEVWVICMTQQ
jgi:hypothetical protein